MAITDLALVAATMHFHAHFLVLLLLAAASSVFPAKSCPNQSPLCKEFLLLYDGCSGEPEVSVDGALGLVFLRPIGPLPLGDVA